MKKWLIDHFLPMWAKETVLKENRKLRMENQELRQNNALQEQFLQGILTGQKVLRKINIYTGGRE